MRSILCKYGIPSSIIQLPWSNMCSVRLWATKKTKLEPKKKKHSRKKNNSFLQISKEREKVELLQASGISRQDFLVSSCHPYCSFSWCECMKFVKCLKAEELIKLTLTVLSLNNESKTLKQTNKKKYRWKEV